MEWSITINAPPETVFRAVSNSEEFAKAIPEVKQVEILSEVKIGVGARFRETREMCGKDVATELEVTEYVDNDRIRMVGESMGTIWDSVFIVTADGDQTRLNAEMTAKTRNILVKFVNLLFAPLVKKAIAKDMKALKTYCEANATD